MNKTTSISNESIEKNTNLKKLDDFKTNILGQILDFLDSTINEKTKKGILEKLNDRFDEIYDAYSITEKKFKYRRRDSGEMYITHINGVLDIYINSLFNLNDKLKNLDNKKEIDRKKAIEFVKNEISIIATIIEHDSIEDTDTTMEGLNERFTSNKLVGFTTYLLSKKPFSLCINDTDDLKEFNEVKKTGILNEKGLISDLIKKKIQVNEASEEELVKYTVGDDHNLTELQINGLEKYRKLENKYKNNRNENYFTHYKSIYSLMKHAKKLLNDKNLHFSKEDFKIIIYNTIIIKLADRIHNLNDIAYAWADKPERIEKKLLETETYLLPIAKEFDNDIFIYITNEIKRIRLEINKKYTSNKVNNIIK
ncbi:MAG: hypothetical protein PHS49_01560 [Candidatus Gracilibacteria bacterium]|nr:hypothetical protein [Candidatus Gracilibacteria bacterium]